MASNVEADNHGKDWTGIVLLSQDGTGKEGNGVFRVFGEVTSPKKAKNALAVHTNNTPSNFVS